MLLNREQDRQRQDPRVKRTRELLKQALISLMMEKSFQAITVQDIAQKATVNRVTFYAHFADKFELLEYALRDAFQQNLHRQLPEGTPYSVEALASLMQVVCEFLAEMAGHCPPPRTHLEPIMEKLIKAEIYTVLKGWLTEAPPRQPTAEQTAMIASWAIYGAAVQWTEHERSQPVQVFVQQTLPLILASLNPARSVVALA